MEEALVKRIMPHSLEAEQSVIGSMIMDRDAILTASEQLVKDDFYHQQYGILFETITELFNSGAPVDLITLQNRLREKNVPPEISSLEYVGDLVTTVPTSARESGASQTDQNQRTDCRYLLSGKRKSGSNSGRDREKHFQSASEPEQQ